MTVQPFSGSLEHGVLPPVAGSGAEEGFLEVASGYLTHGERLTAAYARLEVVPQLSRTEVREHLIMVVDRGDRHVDLGRPVRFVPTRQALHQLKPFDEIPPQGVEIVAIRMLGECPLEVEHHQRPADKDQLVCPLTPEEARTVAVVSPWLYDGSSLFTP
jgi:hypothetical protein